MITTEDYLAYVDHALEAMKAIAAELGDGLVSRRPDLPGANSAYGLAVHCLGVAGYWAGGLVAGRHIDRNRDAEFEAAGTVDELVALLDAGRAQLAWDVESADYGAPLRQRVSPGYLDLPPEVVTQGVVLIHVLEELFQHLGQMEVLRDVLMDQARGSRT